MYLLKSAHNHLIAWSIQQYSAHHHFKEWPTPWELVITRGNCWPCKCLWESPDLIVPHTMWLDYSDRDHLFPSSLLTSVSPQEKKEGKKHNWLKKNETKLELHCSSMVHFKTKHLLQQSATKHRVFLCCVSNASLQLISVRERGQARCFLSPSGNTKEKTTCKLTQERLHRYTPESWLQNTQKKSLHCLDPSQLD